VTLHAATLCRLALPVKAYNAAMPTTSSTVPLVAVIMIVIVLVTVATPARADADVLTALAIASLAVAGIIIVVYLIAAAGSDRGSEAHFDVVPSVLIAQVGQTP
jgi:hypothetical protein